MVIKARIKVLFDHYVKGSSSAEEEREFFMLINDPENEITLHQLMDDYIRDTTFSSGLDKDQKEMILNTIFQQAEGEIPVYKLNPRKTRVLWKRALAAACVLILLSTSTYFYLHTPATVRYTHYKGELVPGGNKATLTLANGTKLSLTDAANGTLAEEASVQIKKTANGQLIYELKSDVSDLDNNEVTYNTISTPSGGQYQVILPDGTHVWLNAASSLKYPTSFAALKERKVELTGEAYFEVSKVTEKSVRKSFLVKSRGQEVEVLGTHFNVNSYREEEFTATTLLEGSVKVKRAGVFEAVISPGEQAQVAERMKVLKVDTSMAVAWKNGVFKFENASITMVMNQFARWYDVDVQYEGKMPGNKFNGEIYRNMNASKAFKILSLAKINFRVEAPSNGHGRKKIVVTQN